MSNTILGQLKLLIESAKGNVSQIMEWSVGDLGKKIDNNITDKVSLKTIKTGDTIVVAKTSISKIAQEQDGDGDVKLTVENISGTTISCDAGSGEKIELDLLDLRILEAYSMVDSDIKIFVVDLPAKVNKDLFGESFEGKSSLVKKIDTFIKDLEDFSDKMVEESDNATEKMDDEIAFNKSDTVKNAKTYLNVVDKYFHDFDQSVIKKIGKKDKQVYKNLMDAIVDTKVESQRNFYYFAIAIDGLIHYLTSFKKSIYSIKDIPESLDLKKKYF